MNQDDSIRISTVRRDRNYSTNPHFHRHNELYYLDEGNSKMFVDTKLYPLREGSLVFVKSGRIHKTGAGNNNSHRRTVLMFPDSMIYDIVDMGGEAASLISSDVLIINVPELERSSYKNIFMSIENELMNGDEMSDILVKSYINDIMIRLIREYKRQSAVSVDNGNMLDVVIRMAIEYICKNYCYPITLEKTAAHVNMSPTYFSKKFKRETGMGFKKYLNKYRMREAENLLKLEPESSISEIAAKCGFSDSNYFATAFKAEYGVSPNRYKHLSSI